MWIPFHYLHLFKFLSSMYCSFQCINILSSWSSLFLSIWLFYAIINKIVLFISFLIVHFCCLVTLSCLTLCDHKDYNMPGFPVFHYLRVSSNVHRVDDVTQPSHPLSPSSPPALNFSQHQGLFQWVGSLHQVAKELGLQLQHQYFQWISRVDFI